MSKRKLRILALGSIPVVALVALAGCSSVRHFVEQPDYEILRDDGKLEIRRYGPTVAAEVEVGGDDRYEGANDGFRPLADYIFGANSKGAEIAMTSPVVQSAAADEGEKIAMTSPVSQQASGDGKWTVRFTMPAKYKLADLPEPKNPAVKLREIPGGAFAAVRFAGRAKDAQVEARLQRLREYIAENGLSAVGEPTYAYYDPPWTLPFLRRNEILIEIDPASIR